MNNATKRLLSLVIVLAMALAMLPVISFAAGTTTTIYCKTAASWTACKVHWWGSAATADTKWPGADMTKVKDGVWTIEVPADAAGLVLNNGKGTQSKDQKVPTDSKNMYDFVAATWTEYNEEVSETAYFVAGSMNGWTNPDAAYKMIKQADGTYALTITVDKGNHELKVTDGTWDNSWGGPSGNYKFTAAEAGEFVVTFDGSTVNVTGKVGEAEPMKIDFVTVVGPETLTGVEWDPADESTTMDQNGQVYTLTLMNVDAGEYEFKFAANGSWDIQWASGDLMVPGETYTAWFAPMGNSKLNVTSQGATVTLTLDLTNMDYITGEGASCSVAIEGGAPVDPVDPPVADATYYVVGDFNGWTNPDENTVMAKQADGTYALTLTMAEGKQALKVTNGTWDEGGNWGGMGENGNYEFKVVAPGNVTVTFDGTTVNVTGDVTELDPEPLAPIEFVSVVGSAGLVGVEWDPVAEDGRMTANGSVYTITFTGIAAGEYLYKFAANGTWDLQWASGIAAENGVEQDAWFAPLGDSSLTVAEDNSTVTMVLDLTNMDPMTGNGGKTTVTIEAPATGATVSGNAASGKDGIITIELIADGAVAYTTTVDGKTGAYSIANVAAGTYTVKVSKADHVDREYELTVSADTTLDVKIHLIGDVNGDGRVNTGDVSKIYAHAKRSAPLEGYEFECADINGDGRVNTGDTSKAYAHAKKTTLLW